MIGILLFLAIALLLIGGREFGFIKGPMDRGFVAEATVARSVDMECIETALQSRFGQVSSIERMSGYVADQPSEVGFEYFRTTDGRARATLTFKKQPGGLVASHVIAGDGEMLPKAAVPLALSAMELAQRTIKSQCGVDLSPMKNRPIRSSI